MIRVTDILTKPVISLINGKTEGIVKSVVFNQNFKKVAYLVLFDNNEHQEEKALSVSNIYNYGENAIIVKDENSIALEMSIKKVTDKPSPINNNVYTYLGKFAGKVSDIILDEKFNVVSIKLGNKEIERENIITVGTDNVVIQEETKKLNVKTLKRKIKSQNLTTLNINANNKVYILNNNLNKINNAISNNFNENLTKNAENSIEITNNDSTKFKDTINTNSLSNVVLEENNLQNANASVAKISSDGIPFISEKALNELQNAEKAKVKYKLSDNPSVPQVVTTNYEFLLGRKLERNIYSSNRELIARKNSKITTDIINKAKMYYKIRELTKYSHQVF